MTYLIPDHALEDLLQTVESGHLARASLTEHCETLRDLKRAIDERCPEGSRTQDTLVPRGHLLRELSALNMAARTLKFSAAWISQCDQATYRQAQMMVREYPASHMKTLWPTRDVDQRLDILRRLAAYQCSLFSRRDLTFTPPTIATEKLDGGKDGGKAGGFNFYAGEFLVAHASEIVFDTKYLKGLNDFNAAAGALWHEQLHSLHYQLGCAHDTLSADHVYAVDAAMMKTKITHNAHLSPRYGTLAYRADVEERLCYGTQDTLATQYEGFSGQYLNTVFRGPAPR